MRGPSGRVESAQAVAYQIWVGDVPADKMVIRTCGEPRCVNPEHLELSDHGVDWYARGRPGKLTRRQRDRVRAAYDAGENMAALARELGVGQDILSRIGRRVCWARDLDDPILGCA
jgi:hypothetical protein